MLYVSSLPVPGSWLFVLLEYGTAVLVNGHAPTTCAHNIDTTPFEGLILATLTMFISGGRWWCGVFQL